jgi:uncharacterized protein
MVGEDLTQTPGGEPPAEDACDEAFLLFQVRSFARDCFHDARGSHDWEHTLRVVRLCRRIGAGEGADMTVLLVAAYLHDVGRVAQDRSCGGVCHAEMGLRLAEPLISHLALSPQRRDNIRHCIRAHRFRNGHRPRTIEAKVLFDADKLDAIGAVGVARAYLFAGELGACLHNPNLEPEAGQAYSRNDTGYREYKVKLCKIKQRMLTAGGLKIARRRHAFMKVFFQRFLAEYQGER